MEYTVVDPSFLENLKRKVTRSSDNPMIADLMKGEILSVQNVEAKKFAGLYQSATLRNKKMNLRSGKIDDVPTIVIWWTDLEPEA